MKNNRNNSVKRTIAGIFAVMAMITATVPMMARADEAPLDITTVMTERNATKALRAIQIEPDEEPVTETFMFLPFKFNPPCEGTST